jgi:hypothetical protein
VIDVVLLWDEIATRGKVMGWVVGRGNNLGSLESLEAGDNVSSDFTTTGDLVERPGFGDDDATTGDLCPSSTTMGWTSDAFREEDAALCEDDGSIREDDFAANIKQKNIWFVGSQRARNGPRPPKIGIRHWRRSLTLNSRRWLLDVT